MNKETKDELQYLFPTIVQISQLENYQELNCDLTTTIEKIRRTEKSSKPQSWACQLYTTIGNPHQLLQTPGFGKFRSLLENKLLQYAKSFGYDVSHSQPRITECWLNVYASGHSQEIHLHRNNMFSGIYYVKAPEGSGPTLFYSPLSDVMLEPRASEGNNLNAKVSGFPPVEGRILIFRSSLRHSVLPGNFKGERITIAFNAVM